jgi:UDP-N-acetylmuramate-alanine ligase
VRYVADVDELLERIPAEVPPQSLVLMLGAGSISHVAHRLGAAIGAPDAVALR